MAGSDDADFAAYVAARWPALVRTVVLAGCPRDRADDVVLDGLAHCRAGWDRMLRSDDVEVHVHEAVLHAQHHQRHQRHQRHRPEPESTAPPPAGEPDPVAELEPRLAALTTEQREALVLRAVAGLEVDQVAAVLDLPAETLRKRVPGAPDPEVVRAAAATIDVRPAPYDDIAVRARGQRRRRRRTVLACVAAGLAVVGGVAWAGTALSRDGGLRERPAHVERVLSPASIAWWADGELHLRRVTVDLPDVTDLVAVGDRVLFLDADGIVGQVEPDGTVYDLGVAVPGSRLVGSTEHGWAAWVEPGDPAARLVVWDIPGEAELGGLRVDASVRPIAIDQGLVQFATSAGDSSWRPPDAEPERLPPTGLVAQSAATRVFQRGERIEIVQPLFGLSFLRVGEGAQLSFGGRYVLSRLPGAPPGGPWRPLLYDTRTGDAIDPGVAPGEAVLVGGFTSLQQVAYLLRTGDEGLLLLRTCEPATGACEDVVPVETGGGPALLAD